MPKKTFRIEGIDGGIASTFFGPAAKDSYEAAFGIDPDFRATTNSRKTGGAITPVGMAKFSSSGLTGYPMWFETTPKTTLVYAYDTTGKFLSYAPSAIPPTLLGTETALTSPQGGAGRGNGMRYYNNYMYLSTPTDISRWGPLNGGAAMADNYWTATLGLTLLTDSTYPTANQLAGLPAYPNHSMHVHTDGFLYFADVISTTFGDNDMVGRGALHRISTNNSGGVEGAGNNGSAYNVLTLPFGYFPIAIQSYGTDIAVLAFRGLTQGAFATTQVLNTGNAALFLWDTFASLPYQQIFVPDPLASAMYANNGRLYVWSGNNLNGVRLSVYEGGDSMRQIAFHEESNTPFQGAVGAWEDRVIFGGQIDYPSQVGVVFSFGSKNSDLKAVVHTPIVVSGGNSNAIVTAVKYVLQADNIKPSPIVGWGDSTSFGIDQYTTTATLTSQMQFTVPIGQPFSVRNISILLSKAVGANNAILPTMLTDNSANTFSLPSINNTTYSGKSLIAIKRPELVVNGTNNLTLNFQWSLTDAISIVFPIKIEIDVSDVDRTG